MRGVVGETAAAGVIGSKADRIDHHGSIRVLRGDGDRNRIADGQLAERDNSWNVAERPLSVPVVPLGASCWLTVTVSTLVPLTAISYSALVALLGLGVHVVESSSPLSFNPRTSLEVTVVDQTVDVLPEGPGDV